MKSKDFPEDFKWGVTISAYQNEGAHNIHGKGPSIWDSFTNKTTFKNGNGNSATNFYSHYKADIKRVKAMNLDCFRFSLSWSRIFPLGIGNTNPEGVQFYHDVIDECLQSNVEPWVTLYHWDLPQHLQDQGGWTNRNILSWFETYASFCGKTYGHKVKTWIILNEPMSFVGLGYFMGIHAPGKKGLKNFLPAAHHAALCQAIGARAIREQVPEAKIGTSFSCSYVKPVNRSVKNQNAANRINAILNRFFIEPSLGLGYPTDVFPGLKRLEKYIKPEDHEALKFDFDFIGVQYYFKVVAKFSLFPPLLFASEIPASKRGVKTNTMNMEIYPKGLFKMLEQFSSYVGVQQIYITESGMCFNDTFEHGKIKDNDRIKYLKQTFKYTLKAINNHIPVKGYFVWTLVDNFEWAEGTKARFGLFYTDFNTQKRFIKKSGLWLKSFLKPQNN